METLCFGEYTQGTAVLTGEIAESVSFAEHTAGMVTLLGVSVEFLTFSEGVPGVVWNAGVSREAMAFSEHSTGTVTILAQGAETLKRFRESGRTILYGWSAGNIAFGEHVTGIAPIPGNIAESMHFAEHGIALVIVPESGEIWCINLATGGHSRYLGAVDGSAPVDAYAITNVNQLGSDKEKYVPEAFLHGRFAGDVELTTITDEEYEIGPYHLESDVKAGMRRRRIPLSKGVKGMDWQFRISNVNGSDITLKSLEVPSFPTKRTQ